MTGRWTQDDAIAFECAKDCIRHLMAICTRELHSGGLNDSDEAKTRAERTHLALELHALHVGESAKIERIRRDYAQRIPV